MTQFELFSLIAKTARRVHAPTWDDVSEALVVLENSTGSVTLDTPGGSRCPELTCCAEGNRYLLTYREILNSGEMIVRSLTVPQTSVGWVGILGDNWDNRMVTQDFQLVVRAFLEFFETGTVGELLD